MDRILVWNYCKDFLWKKKAVGSKDGALQYKINQILMLERKFKLQ